MGLEHGNKAMGMGLEHENKAMGIRLEHEKSNGDKIRA